MPTSYRENLLFRKEIVGNCLENDDYRQEVVNACSRDILFWINTFVWTYDPRKDNPVVPFLTWEFQDAAFSALDLGCGKHDMLIEKSRDMGASWIVLTLFTHRWLFKPMQSFLMVSRKEEYVDKSGDMKGLFQKVDFILDRLPHWMVPSYTRNKLHLKNNFNGSTIDGESTNGDVGRGDRRTAILKDEFASVDNDYEVEAATRDVTKCRLYNSTPKGTSNAFYDKRQKMASETPDRLIRMHWSRHPEKAEGLYRYDTKAERLTLIDEEFKHGEDYRFIRDGKLRSVWYDEQCIRASNQQEIAQEIDIDYKKSGWQFFAQDVVDELIAKTASRPVWTGDVVWDSGFQEISFMPNPDGPLDLWLPLDVNHKLVGQPAVCMGCDIATGKGGSMSSNSVLSAYDQYNRVKVAEYKSNILSPERFADLSTALGRAFSSNHQTEAKLIFEANGPGGQYGKRLTENGYSNLYYRRNEMSDSTKESAVMGWWSTRDTKRLLLGQYATALIDGFAENKSEFALKECSEYIHEPNGNIVHAKSRNSIDPTVSGENHGDCVIADGLAVHLMKSSAEPEEREVSTMAESAPYGSRLWRNRQHEVKKHDLLWVD